MTRRSSYVEEFTERDKGRGDMEARGAGGGLGVVRMIE